MRGLQAARGTTLTSDPAAPGSRRPLWVVLGVAFGVVLLDQLSKWWVQQNLPGREPIHVIGDWLKITYALNPGAAFSMGGSLTIVFSGIALAVVVVIVRVASRLGSIAWAVALGGLLGGALGNLLDRIFRQPGLFRGHVVDWISVPHWPVFNIADSAIFCSAVLMVWLSFRGIGLDGSRPATTG